METAKPRPGWPLRLAMATISVIVFILLCELVLSVVDPDLYYKNQFFPVNRDIDFSTIYQKDSDLFWRFRSNVVTDSRAFSYLTYSINSRGMRGDEIAPNHDGVRVLALGNSCTFGWGVDYADCFTSRLEQMLNERLADQPYEVINAGVPGYSSLQGLRYFERDLLSLQPDMVLIMFGWNDHWPAGKNIADADMRMPPGSLLWLQNRLSSLHLYQLLRRTLVPLTEETAEVRLDDSRGVRRVSREELYANLRRIVQVARRNNITPVLMVPPVASLENYFTGTISEFHRRHALYQAQVRMLSRAEGVLLVDLQEEFDAYYTLYDDATGDPTHFNPQGHAVAANAIYAAIAPQLRVKLRAGR